MSALEQAALLAARAELRRNIAKRLVNGPLSQRAEQGAYAFAAGGETRIIALNFSAEVDFRVGAKHWFDLTIPAQDVLSTVLNSVAWLTGVKRFQKKKAAFGAEPVDLDFGDQAPDENGPPVRYSANYMLETIPEEVTVAGADPRCVGYRLWIILKPLPLNAVAQHLLGINPNPAAGRGDDAGDAGENAPVPITNAVRARAARFQVSKTKWNASPLTAAAMLSCYEARALVSHVAGLRKRAKISVPVPGSLRPYRFAKYETVPMLVDGAVQRFMQTFEAGDMPEDDHNDFLLSDHTNAAQLPAVNPASAYNLDRIFTKERAMVYKTTGAKMDWKSSHCRLSSYIPGATGRLDDGADPNARPTLRSYLHDIPAHYSPMYMDAGILSFPTPSLVYSLNNVATLAEILLPYTTLPWAIGAVLPRAGLEDVDAEATTSLLPDVDDVELLHTQLEAVGRLQAIEELHNDAPAAAAPLDAGDIEPITDSAAMMMRPVSGATFTQGVRIPVPTLAEAQKRLEALQTPRSVQTYDNDLVMIDRLIEGIDDMDGMQAAAAASQHPPVVVVTAIQPELKRVFDEQFMFVRTHFQRTHNEFAQRHYDEFNVEGHGLIEWVSSHSSISSDDLVYGAPTMAPGYHETRILEELNQYAAASSTPELPVTTDMKARVMERIDVTPSYFVERNDFLAARSTNQIKRGLLAERHDAEREALRLRGDAVPELARLQLISRQARELETLTDMMWTALFALIQKTDNAPQACLQARDYATQYLMSQSLRDCDVNSIIDGTSLAHFLQFLTDSFVAVDPVSAQNMPYLSRIYVCSFHAHRYQANRCDPALNYVIAGGTGTGKSYLLRRVASYALEGIVQQTTVATTASYNVMQDFDHTIILYEEMEASLLKKARNNDNGNEDKINYAKARMTSFCTWTQYFYSNPETGKREAHKAVSSQHVVMLAATNQPLDDMDEPMRRRMIIDFVFEISAQTDGGKAQDNEQWSLFLGNAVGKQTQHKHLELHWAYMIVELAIRAGVIDDILEDSGRFNLRNILAEATRSQQISTTHKTRSHWVLEAARTIAILDACYHALYSVDKILVYEDAPSGIKRWAPKMFSRIVTQKLRVTKDHVAYALEMFDFFYASRDDQRLLGTIGERLCHMSDATQWVFRRTPSGSNGAVEIDPNYLIVKGGSDMKILARISDAHKHIAQPRPEDISSLLKPYYSMMLESRGMETIVDNGGKVAGVRRSETGAVLARPALFFEHDPASNANTPKRQLCVSFEFIESRYNLAFETATPEEVRAALTPQDPIFKAAFFADDQHGGTPESRQQGMNIARVLAECGDKRAPMVGAIRRTLSHPVTNKSPFEHVVLLPVDPQCYRLPAFYTPDDVRIVYDARQTPLRIPQQGVQQILEIKRDATRPHPRYDNYARPLPTACASIFGVEESFAIDGKSVNSAVGGPNAVRPDMSRGFVTDKYDIDFDMSVVLMRRYGHPGVPLLEYFYIEQCRIDCGGVDDPAKWALLLHNCPDIANIVNSNRDRSSGGVTMPLPFSFEPIAYRIKKFARRIFLERLKRRDNATMDYSALNIFARVQDSVVRRLAIINHTPGVFEGYTKKIGHDGLFVGPTDTVVPLGTPVLSSTPPPPPPPPLPPRETQSHAGPARPVRDAAVARSPSKAEISATRKRALEWEKDYQRRVATRRELSDTPAASRLRLPPSLPSPPQGDAMDIDAPKDGVSSDDDKRGIDTPNDDFYYF